MCGGHTALRLSHDFGQRYHTGTFQVFFITVVADYLLFRIRPIKDLVRFPHGHESSITGKFE